eukprot:2694301-Pyramimonas_sp.AAC.1
MPLDLQCIQTFLNEIDDDVELAKKGQVKDANEPWTEWCRIAASGGARPLHRTTKVRDAPAPAAAIGIPYGNPVVIVKQEVALYRKLWGASSAAAA